MIFVVYALMCLIWGTTWLAIKFGLHGLPPIAGTGFRFFIAGVFLALVGMLPAVRATRSGGGPPLGLVVTLAFALFGVNYALVYVAETRLASGLVAVLFGTFPFWVFAFGAILDRQPVPLRGLAGATLALAGVAAISLSGTGAISLPHLAAGLLSAALAAYANVVLKRHAATDPFRTLPPAMLLSGVTLSVVGLIVERIDWAAAARPDALGALLYLALAGSGIAFFLNHWLLKRLSTWIVGLATLIIPVIAVAVGTLAGGEHFSAYELLGAALVVIGIAVATIQPQHRVAVPALSEP